MAKIHFDIFKYKKVVHEWCEFISGKLEITSADIRYGIDVNVQIGLVSNHNRSLKHPFRTHKRSTND